MCCKRQPLRFLLEIGPERIQILRHLDDAFDWVSVSSFGYYPFRVSRLLLFSALNYLYSAPCYLNCIYLSQSQSRNFFMYIINK